MFMRKSLIFLGLVMAPFTACHQNGVDSDQQVQILQASVPADPATTFDINHATGTVTVYPASARPNWIRSNVMTIHFQTSPNTVLVPVNSTDTQPLDKQVTIDVMAYDNSKPLRMLVRDQNSSTALYKEYRLQLKAAGPVRFESIPALKDTMAINLTYYQTYLVKLPVNNLYDGNPHDYRIYATLAGSTVPVELTLNYDRYSPDYVQFYFDQQKTKPGVYSVDLRKADGQRVISPVKIQVSHL